jgi:hypothetical protein
MSWLFSRALVEAFSAATSSDGAQSAPSNGSPTPQAYLPSDRMTAFSRPSRFGMTFAPLTDDLGAAVLTWCLEAFRAKTSVLPEKARASLESDPACGPKWRASLARFDPDTSSWRTVQLSLLGDSELSSVTWPRSGMTAGGQCWELPMLALPTSATDSGWCPTPCATDHSNRKSGENIHISATGLPKHIAPSGEKSQMRLSQAVQMWPTPTVCGNYNRKGASATSGDGLATAVRMFRAPNATDGAKWSNQTQAEREAKGQQVRLGHQIGAGGSLNPTWVEWLMGWPLGWTDLKPLATDKSLSAQPPPGACSVSPERKAA